MKLNKLTLTTAITGCVMTSCATFNPGKTAQEWDLTTIGNEKVIPGPITPYIGFEKNQIYGFTGCNTINGSMKISGNKFSANQIATTMKMCPEAQYEQAFLQALGKAKIIEQDKDGFHLAAPSGTPLLSFAPRQLDLEALRGQWLLTEMNGKKVESNEETPFIQFDTKAKRFSGFTGCNRLMSNLDITKLKKGQADFKEMAMTKKFCHNHEVEADFVDVLNHSTIIRIMDGKLYIYGKESNHALVFTKE